MCNGEAILVSSGDIANLKSFTSVKMNGNVITDTSQRSESRSDKWRENRVDKDNGM